MGQWLVVQMNNNLNDPVEKAIQDFSKAKKQNILQCLSQSLDLHPIEQLFGH